jgi:hypothetical protein
MAELADGRGAAVQDAGDLGIGVAEHFVQHEYHAFQRAKGFEHDQDCQGE